MGYRKCLVLSETRRLSGIAGEMTEYGIGQDILYLLKGLPGISPTTSFHLLWYGVG
jgi:hypothetical protein